MKTKFYYLAIAALLAGCANDEYVGDTAATSNESSTTSEIQFSSANSNLTRATEYSGANAAKILNYEFHVLGTKGTTPTSVFANSTYNSDGLADGVLYKVWYNGSKDTESNTEGWEYVGAASAQATAGSVTVTPSFAQSIKYWDYSASQYDFVAYSNLGGATITAVKTYSTPSFTATGTATQIAQLYVADKKTVQPTSYGSPVTFTFRALGAKVRLGIYETISGYKVTGLKFYYNTNEGSSATNDGNAYLSGSFLSASDNSTAYTITYDETSGAAKISTLNTASATYFDFGTITVNNSDSPLGTTSTSPTWAISSTPSTNTAGDYGFAIPNASGADMTLKVDITLTSDDGSGETITINDAEAVVPSEYMKWQSNYAYTYLFKISNTVGGTTGSDDPSDTDPALVAITLDAVVEESEEGTTTILTSTTTGTGSTTTTTPSITTYQAGSVVSGTDNDGITYKAGTIYVSVYEGTDLAELTSGTNIWVYKLIADDASTLTEADIDDTYLGNSSNATSVDLTTTGITTVGSFTFTSGYVGSFTAAANSYYAVKYTNTTGSYYKIIAVAAAAED